MFLGDPIRHYYYYYYGSALAPRQLGIGQYTHLWVGPSTLRAPCRRRSLMRPLARRGCRTRPCRRTVTIPTGGTFSQFHGHRERRRAPTRSLRPRQATLQATFAASAWRLGDDQPVGRRSTFRRRWPWASTKRCLRSARTSPDGNGRCPSCRRRRSRFPSPPSPDVKFLTARRAPNDGRYLGHHPRQPQLRRYLFAARASPPVRPA